MGLAVVASSSVLTCTVPPSEPHTHSLPASHSIRRSPVCAAMAARGAGGSHRMTPAQAAGVDSRLWEIEDMVAMIEEGGAAEA